MAITLEANYSKKLGLPQYSSHQFSVTVRTEVSDLSQIDSASTHLYHQLQQAVDRDIQNTGFLPGNEAPKSRMPPFQRGASTSPVIEPVDNFAWNCSDKQKGLIQKLIKEHGIGESTVEALAQQRFNSSLQRLNKMQASGLIDELFNNFCGKSGTRKGGTR